MIQRSRVKNLGGSIMRIFRIPVKVRLNKDVIFQISTTKHNLLHTEWTVHRTRAIFPVNFTLPSTSEILKDQVPLDRLFTQHDGWAKEDRAGLNKNWPGDVFLELNIVVSELRLLGNGKQIRTNVLSKCCFGMPVMESGLLYFLALTPSSICCLRV